MILIAVSCVLGLAAIACFKIKYTDTKEYHTFLDRLKKLEDYTHELNPETIKDIERDVQTLKNMNNMSSRRR
jgi:hypothetical protein